MKKVILFTTPYCQPCKAFKPIFAAVDKEFPEIEFEVLDATQARTTAANYQVRSVPTLIVLEDGEIIAKKLEPSTREDILEALEED